MRTPTPVPVTKRFRMIIPKYPNIGIFSRYSSRITSLGAVVVSTIVNKNLPHWTVEIIDENNCHKGPKKLDGSIDHEALQKNDPADAVGFYCGLSCTMPRVWQVAEFYKSQNVLTIAGGWHVRYAPQESIDKGIDVVVTGDGENAILDILSAFDRSEVPFGIYQSQAADLDALPVPDFGLLRFARIRVYPIGRIRGCSMQCEFCSVKDKPRWSQVDYLFQTVKWLVETRQANCFFITDDRLEEDKPGYMEFFRRISEYFGKRLIFNVQVRLAAAKDRELIEAMKDAGVRTVCIGFESPIDEELLTMNKGLKVADMVNYARTWHEHFHVHGMFIFGYPLTQPTAIAFKERIKRFKRFIRQSRIDSIQILRPVPLIGSKLRERLDKSGQLLPLDVVGWDHYDGNFACFTPDNMTFEELQRGPTKIMLSFYNCYAKIKLPWRTINLPFLYPFTGWQSWYRRWSKEVIRFGAHRLLKQWRYQERNFLQSIKEYIYKRYPQLNSKTEIEE